jgi:DNA-3-methyladenine glycosylase I
MTNRCDWVSDHPLYIAYHDHEWGVPVHDDQKLFEMLILEGAQAGLNWLTILKKREGYRRALANFDPNIVATFKDEKTEALRNDTSIIRNYLKIAAAIQNAKMFLKVQKEFGSFDAYIWGFVGKNPIQNSWQSLVDVPAKTHISEVMSKELKKREFRFVGPTICYAFMQATGMVNDHTTDCFRYQELCAQPQ